MSIERTLVIMKPDAIKKRITGIVLDRIEHYGFELVAAKVTKVSKKLAEEHYRDIKKHPAYEDTIKFMMGEFHDQNKVYVFVFEGENVINKVREVLGATNPHFTKPWTIRGAFGQIKKDHLENVAHASSSVKEAKREIALWFKKEDFIK
ncbi:MAG: nucleoside-diphosphate kinase [Elusimicrobiaceae bacterium]|jgi:nucleoside-diphosphate kinase|nr:nucleoside-diphosphate kinase [Elusimicrobiaceae bacterium]MBT3955576.1 nucleoside-diphosphate kinase [Elusimicrobiaceae bacterium]MBT4008661.1 nucleoside-diphosphate kinase [Elusimicrobiaceae bacterium]MBT4403043.1 nucleoside-diphosphate kinase [Elusimicrobiaceae bacterium]MBT4439507.1 nucleoside-diphosphate kinase [Elusimicrobiaceae bacterium]